jgi:hypothetical protein
LPLPCPRCSKVTCSLKYYHILNVVFLLFAFRIESDRLIACPRCMRRLLALHSLVWLLIANLLWPVLVLAPNLVHFLMTFRRGHSGNIRDIVWRQLTEAQVQMRRGR